VAQFNKFRGSDDVNALRFLTIYAVQTKQAKRVVTDEKVDMLCEVDAVKCLQSILKSRPACFCINNNSGELPIIKKLFDKKGKFEDV
jgi:hypothetical protein